MLTIAPTFALTAVKYSELLCEEGWEKKGRKRGEKRGREGRRRRERRQERRGRSEGGGSQEGREDIYSMRPHVWMPHSWVVSNILSVSDDGGTGGS